MRNIIKVLWTGIAIAQLAALGVQAATTYQLDNGTNSGALNASDGTEPRDNWYANEFTAVAGANLLTRVDYGLLTASPSYVADVVIYQQGALGFTRIYTQQFTPIAGVTTSYSLQQVPLTTPVALTPGANFLVAIFMANVIALAPNDKYPMTQDTSGVATGSFWDRSTPNTFDLDNISGAVLVSQMLPDSTWAPGANHLVIRAVGTAVHEPSVCALGGLAIFLVAMLRRRAK
jgi:hypothetical protein